MPPTTLNPAVSGRAAQPRRRQRKGCPAQRAHVITAAARHVPAPSVINRHPHPALFARRLYDLTPHPLIHPYTKPQPLILQPVGPSENYVTMQGRPRPAGRLAPRQNSPN